MDSAALAELKAAVGPDGWTDDAQRIAPHLVEWRGAWAGTTPLMLTPGSTEQVAAAVRATLRRTVPSI